jgi:hypothetical protein
MKNLLVCLPVKHDVAYWHPISSVLVGSLTETRLLCYNRECLLEEHMYGANDEDFTRRLSCPGNAHCICIPNCIMPGPYFARSNIVTVTGSDGLQYECIEDCPCFTDEEGVERVQYTLGFDLGLHKYQRL